MNKQDYLMQVQPYVESVASAWRAFPHRYRIHDKEWINANGDKENWGCGSLEDAKNKYWWNGTLDDATTKLSVLAEKFQSTNRDSSDKQARSIALDVFEWGGVASKPNVDAVRSFTGDFRTWISDAIEELTFDNDEAWRFAPKGKALRMNSAFTKLYAVIDPSLIIYDGRVGAALGLLAESHVNGPLECTEELKKLIAFPWGSERVWDRIRKKVITPAAGDSKRNPSVENFKCSKLRGDDRHHAKWAIRASWVVEDTVRRLNKEPAGPKVNSRDIEAALFMIGYDVKRSPACCV